MEGSFLSGSRVTGPQQSTTPDHANISQETSWLFDALNLIIEFEESDNMDHLQNAIMLMKIGLQDIQVDDPFYSLASSGLAGALHTRFQLLNNSQDLDESISLYRQGLKTEDPLYPGAFSQISLVLLTRFHQRGDLQDLDESVSLYRQALGHSTPSDPNHSGLLNDLGAALWTRCQHRGSEDDLRESITLHREALRLRPQPHPDRSSSLSNLASALQTQFQQRGHLQDLNECISLHRQATELIPLLHPDRSGMLSNLANALQTRFEQEGDANDLQEAVSCHRQALELIPPSDPARSLTFNNLANVLRTRFEHQGDAKDLDESVLLHKQALELRPPSHPERCWSLNNLAIALSTRFEQRGDPRDLDDSIFYQQQALESFPPSHPECAMVLTNLAIALSIRFEKRGDSKDLHESISLHRRALELTRSSHLHRFKTLNNLAIELRTCFLQRGEFEDLDESISYSKQAIDLIPASHPNRPGLLNNLASTLMIQFEHRSDSVYLDQALAAFSDAARCLSQSSSARFRAAAAWAHYADLHEHKSAIDAFDTALSILPQLAALSLDLQSRQDSLMDGTDGIARNAANCAIRVGNLEKAIEFLETGRSVFWSQYLHLRSPLNKLDDAAPHLASKLRQISKELEEGSHRKKLSRSTNNKEKSSWEEEANRFEKLAREWKETIDQVRDLNGFEDFLEPQKLSKLRTAALRGPIVYLVANDETSHCLILTSTSVKHVPLPNLPTRVLFRLAELVRFSASEYQAPHPTFEEITKGWNDLRDDAVTRALQHWMEERGMRPARQFSSDISSDDMFIFILKTLWEEAVKLVIDFLKLKKSSQPPTLTWCMTGLFNFLPMHAAGLYEEEPVEYASNYIVSTYTPTVEALLTPDHVPAAESFKMMVVVEPRTLPSTREELRRIEKHVAPSSLIKFGVSEGVHTSVEEVASCLSSASVVHFACHGRQHTTKPLESGLEIGDGRLTISRIMKESVPNGSVAFLSACETATGDEIIPDEAMNIGTCVLFTGFQSVVATMWKIWDRDGPVIADAFYEELFKDLNGNHTPLPHSERSAEALAIATRKLRGRGVPFKRWVPFIHIGK